VSRLAAVIHLAFWSVFSRPARLALLIATLGGGAAGVAVAAGVLTGYAQEMERMAFGAYARSLVITENVFVDDRYGPPRIEDLDRLREALGADVEAMAAWRSSRADVRINGAHAVLPVRGVTGDYRREADMPLAEGRAMTHAEAASAQRICLLGDGAARQLFEAQPAVGERIRINGVSCEVIGVFGAAENQLADRYRQSILAPFAASARYFEDPSVLGGAGPRDVSQLTVVLTPQADRSSALIRADQTLRRTHGAPQSQVSPFQYADPNAPRRALERQRDLVGRLLVTIALVTLLVAFAGYAAASNAAIDMRRRDIALQMMSGATGRLITFQILIEGLIVGLAASAAGAALVLAGGVAARSVARFPFEVSAEVVAAAFFAGALTGVMSSLPAAHRAASGSPALTARA